MVEVAVEAAVAEDNMNKYMMVSIIVALLIVGSFFIKTSITGNTTNNPNLEKITLNVAIPCGGHAYLIEKELKKLNGVESVTYLGNFKFEVYYDSTKILKADILNLDIFKNYPAKLLN